MLLNKSDLPPAVDAAEVRQLNPAAEVLTLSAVQGESLAPLKARLTAFAQGLEQSPLTQQRHLDAARRASAALREAQASWRTARGWSWRQWTCARPWPAWGRSPATRWRKGSWTRCSAASVWER